MEYQIYQVFNEGADHTLNVNDFDTLQDAEKAYNEHNGFLLLGVDAPTAFEVIYARPYGMCLIS